jgi:hypothetical protein
MSHRVTVAFQPACLKKLKTACERLGVKMTESQNTVTLNVDGYPFVGRKIGESWVLSGEWEGTRKIEKVAEEYYMEEAKEFCAENGMEFHTERLPNGALQITMVEY